MKAERVLVLAVIVLCGALAMVVLRNAGSRVPAVSGQVASSDNHPATPLGTARSVRVLPPEPAVPPVTVGGPPTSTLPVTAQAGTPSRNTQTAVAKKGKDPIKDPLAREALAWVGCSEVAEAYWVEAINDPNLPAEERQDLIEDLNEDGISDPKHPSLEDLPLILNRLELIEWLAPDSMDQVNEDAFMEAYKDLVNLAQVSGAENR